MSQLIARIDKRLHARLKERAALEGRPLNAVVTEALEDAVADGPDETERVRRRLDARGGRVVVPQPARAPSEEELDRATRGAGEAVSEALRAERDAARAFGFTPA